MTGELRTIKFGRYAIRSRARKRIERATHGAAHFVVTHLVIGGRVASRGQLITDRQMIGAEIQLGWGPLYTHKGLTR